MDELIKAKLKENLGQMIRCPNESAEILATMMSITHSLQAGRTMDASMSKWFGQNTPLGITSSASLISWLSTQRSNPIKWVIRDSVASCMAAYGIKTLRQIETTGVQSQLNYLQRIVSAEVTNKVDFFKVLQEFIDSQCIDIIDVVELIDALENQRVQLPLVASVLRSMLKVIKLYVIGSGNNWPNHGGTVKTFGFEVCARLIAALLKKMIMADECVAPEEVGAFYEILAERYAMPPEQAQWIYEAAPLDYEVSDICADILAVLSPDRVGEIYEVLERIAMADQHFDSREKKLLNTIHSCLTIDLSLDKLNEES